MDKIILISGIHGLILGGVLSVKRNFFKKHSNIFFLMLVFDVSLYLIIQKGIGPFSDSPKLFLSSYLLVYFFTPLYFLYLSNFKTEGWQIKKNWWVFLPALVYLALLFPYLLLPSAEVLSQSSQMDELLLADLLAIVVNIVMLVKCFRFKKSIEESPSKRHVFTAFQIIMLIVNVLWFIVLLSAVEVMPSSFQLGFNEVFLIMSGLIFLFGYYVMARGEVFDWNEVTNKNRYEKVNFDEKEIQSIGEQIVKCLRHEQPYLNPEFKLSDLEKQLSVDRFKLSYTLNNHLKMNFKKLVNTYRVERFLELMESKELQHFNIAGIAEESGFKSKSTFYKAFKEIKGLTPKEYFNSTEINSYSTPG